MEAIGETASRIGETAAQIQEAGSQIGETGLRTEENTNALKALEFSPVQESGFSVREPIKLPSRKGKLFI